jgi:hypothetical protein
VAAHRESAATTGAPAKPQSGDWVERPLQPLLVRDAGSSKGGQSLKINAATDPCGRRMDHGRMRAPAPTSSNRPVSSLLPLARRRRGLGGLLTDANTPPTSR